MKHKELVSYEMKIECTHCKKQETARRWIIRKLDDYKYELFNKFIKEFTIQHKECGEESIHIEIRNSYWINMKGCVFMRNERINKSHIIEAMRKEAAKQQEEYSEWTEYMMRFT